MRWFPMVVLLAAAAPCQAQFTGEARSKGSLFLEVGGNAAFGVTGNVEFSLSRSIALRAGAGLDVYSRTLVFPIQTVFLLGQGPSRLEASAGITIANEPAQYSGNWHWDGTKAFFSGFLGYRYQRRNGFLFRIGVVPLLWTNKAIPWVAISVGGSF